MACSLLTLSTGALGLSHAFPVTTKLFNPSLRRSSFLGCSLKLSSSGRRTQFSQLIMGRPSYLIHPFTGKGWKPVTVMAAKGYKMKTHKASAKRFRVTGKGKIVRRRAGKQHLLVKKNTKRRNRLSKMAYVDRSDYDNVIRALPYLKVNRKAT
ncbi:large ribosomal subunit protein bL35c [Cryptomeria japonica]|uniref:large ribosomal subunit protein bL35c n=1 Tax=Cryptomeria japonica TaxID=3369 RepID=UPI0025AD5F46|nr:large ribosomal subunit protein bL35c [Cryptomeria japonica]